MPLRRSGRPYILISALTLVVVSLALLLALQWRALHDIRDVEPKARWAAMRDLVQTLAQEPRLYYRPRARRSLMVPYPLLYPDKRAALAAHFDQTRFEGMRDFFIIDMSDPRVPLFYDPQRHAFVPRPDRAAITAPVVADWLKPRVWPNSGSIISPTIRWETLFWYDDDPRNHLMVYPVFDEERLLAMTGFVFDEHYLLEHIIPEAVRRELPRFLGNRAGEVVIAVRDSYGRPLWENQRGLPQRVDVHYQFEYLFRTWTIGAQSKALTPEQFADRSFRITLAIDGLVALVAVAAIIFAFHVGARGARVAAMKEAFVSNVTHELRTPLASIVLFGRLLRLGEERKSETMRYGAFIEAEGERLSRMVEKILTFSRSRRQPLRKESTDLAALVRTTMAELKPALDSRGFAADVDCEGGPLLAPVDTAALREAIRNLVDNAVSYSGESRRLRVRAVADNGEVAISVTDYGIGIATPDLRRIFDRFYRGSDARVAEVRGTGIGLSIVRAIAEGHGGTVTVQSRVGAGSTFTIRLPRQPEEPCTVS